MKIHIDIGHPAHVHYFRNAIKALELKNHQIQVTTRDKEVSLSLLDYYNIPYKCTGKNRKSVIGKALSIFRNDYYILKSSLKFKPDLFLSFCTPFSAQVGYLLGKPVIGFLDTENAKLNLLMSKAFTNVILTPSCYIDNLGDKQIKFSGYMEICYLHPKYFTPDKSVYKYLDIDEKEKYVILRFVSWRASHDYGHKGILDENKARIVSIFGDYAKVFISSENELPPNLKKYQLNIPPHLMHSAIYYSSLLYGESATMASEAAILGTPSIYLDDDGRGYTKDQSEKYGIVFNYSESIEDQEKSINKGLEILKENNKLKYKKISQTIINDHIDVTTFMVWFVENYPNSYKTLKINPDFQFEFK